MTELYKHTHTHTHTAKTHKHTTTQNTHTHHTPPHTNQPHTHTHTHTHLYIYIYICDRLWENRAQRGMRRRRKKIDLILKIVLNKPNEGNGYVIYSGNG